MAIPNDLVEIPESVADGLRKYIRNTEKTQFEVGRMLGVSQGAVSDIARRRTTHTRPELLLRIVELAGRYIDDNPPAERSAAAEPQKSKSSRWMDIGECLFDMINDMSSSITRPIFNTLYPDDGRYILIINTLGKENAEVMVVERYKDLFAAAERVGYNWITGDSLAVKLVIRLCAAVGVDILPNNDHMLYYSFRSDKSEHDLRMAVRAITKETGFLVFICRYSLMGKGITPSSLSPDEASMLAEYRKMSTDAQRIELAKAAKAIAEGHHCHCGDSEKMGEAGGAKPRASKRHTSSHTPSTDTTQPKSVSPSSSHPNRMREIVEADGVAVGL